MAYVITEPCIGEKDNSCVEVCPVDCIHPTPDEPDYEAAEQLFIDPDECIDCDACVEACPVDAMLRRGPGSERVAGLHRAQRRPLLGKLIPTRSDVVEPDPLRLHAPSAPPRSIRGLHRCSQLALWAGVIAVTIQLIAPFDHGVWLIAYLLLVGSLAPYLLGVGEAALLGNRSVGRAVNAQPALWAAGTIAVPTGVLFGSRLPIALGSLALSAALGSMASAGLASRPQCSPHGRGRLELAYGVLILFMTTSVGVGLILAWDISWF